MRQVKDYNFSKGLLTEVSPLSYPENSCIAVSNYDFYRTGLIARRLGMQAESDYTLQPAAAPISFDILSIAAIGSNVWNAVNQDGNLNFNVVQTYKTLYFHNMSNEGAISTNILPFTVNLQEFAKNVGIDAGKFLITAVPANGVIYIFSAAINPFMITYDADTNDITTTPLNFLVRDLDGLDDGLAPDETPPTLSPEHHYNLLNQGWLDAQITQYVNFFHVYPSNAQVPYEAIDPTTGEFSPPEFNNVTTGTTAVARGKFLLNPFDMDYSTVSGVPGLTSLVTPNRPTGAAYYAGRIWLAVGNNLYFSQIIVTDPLKAQNLYQAQDPTAQIFNALLPSDGGNILFENAGTINVLLSTQVSLIIGANNGTFSVSGGQGQNFNATNFRTSFIGTLPILGANNMCQVESTVWVVSIGGIYVLNTDQLNNIYIVGGLPITQNTIQTFYLQISNAARQQSTIFYDPSAKKVYLAYDNDATGEPGKNKYQYTSLLIYDISLGELNGEYRGWTTRTLKAPADQISFISDSFLLNTPILVGVEDPVVIGNDAVTINGVPVVIEDNVPVPQEVDVGYLILSGNETDGFYYTFGQFNNQNFFDFQYVDDVGGDYYTYLITGWQDDTFRQKDMLYRQRYQIDTSKLKGVPYILVYSQRTEQNIIDDGDGNPTYDFPSGTMLQAIWDWSNQYGDFLRNSPQQVYRFKKLVPIVIGQPFQYPYDVIETKTTLRGHGKCLSLLFSAETGKDSRLWAWAMEYQIADVILS